MITAASDVGFGIVPKMKYRSPEVFRYGKITRLTAAGSQSNGESSGGSTGGPYPGSVPPKGTKP